MPDTAKYLLAEDRIPKAWYNIAADLPSMPPPPLHPGTGKPIGPDDLAPLFPMALIGQEVSAEREIEIPGPVRDVYKLWRPAPLYRAHRLEKALDTPARIFYKYEGVSPPGSHKPNTAVAQAFYNREAGVRKLSTETGAGQWGSSLAFAGQLFGIEVKVYMVKVSFNQKPYRRALMETYGATCIASPSDQTDAGKAILAKDPNSPGSLGIAISEAVEVAAKNPDTNYSLGSVLNHVLIHQSVIGLEAIEQMEMAGYWPDVVIGCAGGGSNFAGLAFPFIGKKLRENKSLRAIAAEPAACPTLTRGTYAYDFGDTGQPDAAGQDAHAGLNVHPARLPRRRAALPRHGADGEPSEGAGADRGQGGPPDRLLRGRRPVRPHGGHRAGTGVRPTPSASPSTRRCAASRKARPRRSSSTSPATATSTCRPTPTISPANSRTATTRKPTCRRHSPPCRR